MNYNVVSEDKIKAVADHYGLDVQLRKLAEECGEYAAAMAKYANYEYMTSSASTEERRKHFEKKTFFAGADCLKEFSDVLVLAYQMIYLLEKDRELKNYVMELIKQKIDRQLIRISEEPTS